MDLIALEVRQAITAWRDQAILDCADILNAGTTEATRLFEAHLHNAGPLDIIWDPAAFAAQKIDPLMTSQCAPALFKRLSQAGNELVQLEKKFSSLGEALRQTAALSWENGDKVADQSTAQPPHNPAAASSKSWPRGLIDQAIELGYQTKDAITSAAESASKALKDRTILHNRLRSAAQRRIEDYWMGYAGIPRPVLAKIVLMVDETAAQARMMQ